MSVSISVEGRAPEPWNDVLPRLQTLIEALSMIDRVEAEIHITIDVRVGDELEEP